MLELLGDEYIFQHIYSEQYKEFVETSYKVYVTDMLKGIAGTENRWYPRIADLEKPQKPEPTVEELADMVRAIH